MMLRTVTHWSCVLGLWAGLSLGGCAKPAETGPASTTETKPAAGAKGTAEQQHTHSHGHSHDGWWCPEHGVPEGVCGQCDSKLAAAFQKKGDWCKKHERPDSQCFVCHPELQAQFAAQYEAKYGKQPPKPE